VGVGRHLYFAKKFDAAIDQFKRVLKMDPNSFYAHAHLGQTYIAKSMYSKAITHFTRAIMLTGGKEAGMLSGLGYAQAVSGNHEEARRILDGLQELSNQRYVPAFYIAGIYVGLGDGDRAFQWLEKAFTDRSEWLIYLNIEPMLDPIRNDPRFDEMVKKVGLVN
jgi:tetratricopeptide (TPR) repeat protein